MDKRAAKERILRLRQSINRYRYEYHVLDKLSVSEAALDSLKHELSQLEEQYPELVTPDSPTQRVAGRVLDEFKKVRHLVPMLSLNDAFSKKELEAWVERVQKLIPGQKFQYFAEPKLDGLAVSLVYENSRFISGTTRGDGKVGEDVTMNLRTIESIPLQLELHTSHGLSHHVLAKAGKTRIEIRGEVVISRKDFAELNKIQAKKGLPAFANPRNLAAGSIRQLDPKLAAARKLDFVAYQVIAPDLPLEHHSDEHALIAAFGFKSLSSKICDDLASVQGFLDDLH